MTMPPWQIAGLMNNYGWQTKAGPSVKSFTPARGLYRRVRYRPPFIRDWVFAIGYVAQYGQITREWLLFEGEQNAKNAQT